MTAERIAELEAALEGQKQKVRELEFSNAELEIAVECRDCWLQARDKTISRLTAQLSTVTAERDRYREALDRIADPITYLRKNLKQGEVLNGQMAVALTETPSYAREIAREAREPACPDCGASLVSCRKWKQDGKEACCPDCNGTHKEAALPNPAVSGVDE